ncbi:MAG: hypothetical protein Q9219_002476 [cf. Caloplaca sp. 3 TL-2023]
MSPISSSLEDGRHFLDTDEYLRPSTTAAWDLTSHVVDFASPHVGGQGQQGLSRHESFDSAAANRPDRNLAPSGANYVSPYYNGQQRHQSSAIPSTNAQSHYHTETDQYFLGGDWSNFPHSIPTPPDPSPVTPFSQSILQDGAEGSITGNSLGLANTLAPSPDLTVQAHTIPEPEVTRHSKANTTKKAQKSASTSGSVVNPLSPSRQEGKGRKEQRKVSHKSAMGPSGLSQRVAEDTSKTTPPARKPAGSLSSAHSDKSHTSRTSFDFAKVDRSGESSVIPGILRASQRNSSNGQRSLPDEKGFTIQIGPELFKLSGASIMSDEQLEQNDDHSGGVRTLYIDRDPDTFRDIARHLQVPRLQSQLFESEIFVEVGNEHFRVPRDIFSAPGDTPNYFTLGFTLFFSSPGDIFPGLNPRGLLRPPVIHPPHIPNRSPEIFADLLHMLRGYPLTIRNSDHREQLLKDARYYHLRGLEQRLIPHAISHNIARRASEIVIRLQDIKPSQIVPEPVKKAINANDDDGGEFAVSSPPPLTSTSSLPHQPLENSFHITYTRPYISESSHHLIIESPSSSTDHPVSLNLTTMRATFFGPTKARITSLFQTVANKLNLPTTLPLGLLMMMEKGAAAAAGTEGGGSAQKSPGSTPLSEDEVLVRVDGETSVVLDGAVWEGASLVHPTSREEEGEGEGAEGFEQPALVPSPPPLLDLWQEQGPELDIPPPSNHRNATKRPFALSPSRTELFPSKRRRPVHYPESSHEKQREQRRQEGSNPTTTTTTTTTTTWSIHRGQWRLQVRPRSSASSSSSAAAAAAATTTNNNHHENDNGGGNIENERGLEIVMVAVKLEATTGERARNAMRGFLD